MISWSRYFDGLATRYAPWARYSQKCINTGMGILADRIDVDKPDILDVGSGTGYPASVMGQLIPSARIYMLDISVPMLKASRDSWTYTGGEYAWLVGNALSLPFKSMRLDAITSCCMIVFISNRLAFFREAGRVLKNNGILFIATYDPEDLCSQIFDMYFPDYLRYDRYRHPPMERLISELEQASFEVIDIQKVPYSFTFKTREELLSFISSRPLSTFAHYSDEEFEEAFSRFRLRVEAELPKRDITNSNRLTYITALWKSGVEDNK